MKFFNWVHNKIKGGQRPNESDAVPPKKSSYRASSSGLFSIGTFGNNRIDASRRQQQTIHEEEQCRCSSPPPELTDEEVGNLQKELTKLLRLESNRFTTIDSNEEQEEEIEKAMEIILERCKDVKQKKKKEIGKTSFAFLLKKMFISSKWAFGPAPGLKDNAFHESRMEKLMRTLISKKLYYQTHSTTSWRKTYIEKNTRNTEEKESKWNKTDSEYIVLEI